MNLVLSNRQESTRNQRPKYKGPSGGVIHSNSVVSLVTDFTFSSVWSKRTDGISSPTDITTAEFVSTLSLNSLWPMQEQRLGYPYQFQFRNWWSLHFCPSSAGHKCLNFLPIDSRPQSARTFKDFIVPFETDGRERSFGFFFIFACVSWWNW